MSGLPPPPPVLLPPRRTGPSLVIIIVLAVALVAVVIIAAVAFVGQPATTGATAISSTPSTGPSPTSSSKPQKPKTPPNERPLVSDSFSDAPNRWTEGVRLWFGMGPFKYPDDKCRVDTYKAEGKKGVGVFESDCSDWQSSGYDVLFFYVDFVNKSKQPVTLALRNFVLQSRKHESFQPVNVRSQADFPAYFMNETQKVAPGGSWRGYVTFDGRLTGIVPASLNYIDGKQTLRKTFDGQHAVVLPNG